MEESIESTLGASVAAQNKSSLFDGWQLSSDAVSAEILQWWEMPPFSGAGGSRQRLHCSAPYAWLARV